MHRAEDERPTPAGVERGNGEGRTVRDDRQVDGHRDEGHVAIEECLEGGEGVLLSVEAALPEREDAALQLHGPRRKGDLFGLALKPDGYGIYYVEDATNYLAEDTP